jgi:hypothetical protein
MIKLANIIAVVFFSIVLLVIIFNQVVSNNLILNLDPGQYNLFLDQDSSQNISFRAEALGPVLCDITCSYEYIDISGNEVLQNGTFSGTLNKQIGIKAPNFGKGQKLYSFEVKCTNDKSGSCKNKELRREISALITLNYDLSTEREDLKNQTRNQILDLYNSFASDYSKYWILNESKNELSDQVLIPDISDLDKKTDRLLIEFNNVKGLWENEEYEKISDITNISSNLDKYSNSIKEYRQLFISTLEMHNKIVSDYNYQVGIVQEIMGIRPDFLIVNRADEFKQKVLELNFDSYDNLRSDLENLEIDIGLTKRSALDKRLEQQEELNMYINIEKNLLCKIKGICVDVFDVKYQRNKEGIDSQNLKVCKEVDQLRQLYPPFDTNESNNTFIQEQVIEYERTRAKNILFSEHNKRISSINSRVETLNSLVFETNKYCEGLKELFNDAQSINAMENIIEEISDSCPGVVGLRMKRLKRLDDISAIKTNIIDNISNISSIYDNITIDVLNFSN